MSIPRSLAPVQMIDGMVRACNFDAVPSPDGDRSNLRCGRNLAKSAPTLSFCYPCVQRERHHGHGELSRAHPPSYSA